MPIPKAMLFNNFTSYLEETKCIFIRFINISLRKAINALKSSVAIQGDLNRVEDSANSNLMKFNKHN